MEGVRTEVKEVRKELGRERLNILKATTKLTTRKRIMMAYQDQGWIGRKAAISPRDIDLRNKQNPYLTDDEIYLKDVWSRKNGVALK